MSKPYVPKPPLLRFKNRNLHAPGALRDFFLVICAPSLALNSTPDQRVVEQALEEIRPLRRDNGFPSSGTTRPISDVGSHAISPIPPTATECMRSNEMSLRANRVLMHCNRRCPRWLARGVGHLVCGCGNCQIVHNHCGRGRQTPETSDGDDQTPHVRGGVRCRRDDAYAHRTRWLGAE